MAKAPKFVTQKQSIASSILHSAVWLTWVILVASNRRMLGWVARRYAGITDFDRVEEGARRVAFLLAFAGTTSLFIAVGSLFADYYLGLLGIPAAFLLYGISIWLLAEHYQGPLVAHPHPFGRIRDGVVYLYGMLKRVIEVIRHGTP